jgi:uncharacterized protein YbjQ (UPF0145 family)
MEPPITGHDLIDHEAASVHHWRASQLKRLGFPGSLAEVYADRIDWHQIARLVRRGCPLRLWTALVTRAWQKARGRLEDDVRRLGAEGVVIAGMRMRARERDCPVATGRRDHIVEVTLTGTAIAGFSRVGQSHAGPALAVMPLGARPPQPVWARQDR